MFIYSPRPDTPASDMEQVPLDVKKQRMARLKQVQDSITVEANKSKVGQVFEVLREGPSDKHPGRLQGYSRDFRKMHFDGDSNLKGQLVQVRDRWSPVGMFGRNRHLVSKGNFSRIIVVTSI